MAVDPSIRRSILQILSRDRDAYVAAGAIAEESGVPGDLIEASLDVMQEQGFVRVERYFGGGCDAMITSRGYLEARRGDDAAPGAGGGREAAVKENMAVADARGRLQQQLDEVEALIGRGRSATLDEIKDWTYWTVTVVERIFGGNSRELGEFRGVSGGLWPSDYEGAEADGYRERLPQWRRLLKTWVREIDEFGPEAAPVERYMPRRSQFDAYVFLKETLARAAGSVTLVDPYTDHTTLQPLVSVGAGVQIRVLTVNPSRDFKRALDLFRQQWSGKIEARRGSKELHDRFLVVDDKVFFSGASFKDLGQKGSIVDEIRIEAVKNALKKDIETWWEVAEPIV